MDAIYRLGEAPATDVADELKDEDSFDSIRVTLGILEKKGHLKKRRDGHRNVYSPAVPFSRAKRRAKGSGTSLGPISKMESRCQSSGSRMDPVSARQGLGC